MYRFPPPPPDNASSQATNLDQAKTRSLTHSFRRLKPPRDRPRAYTGTPAAVLAILSRGQLTHVPTLIAACHVPRNTIHQAICRLRRDGFQIETYPPPRGPYRCEWYRLMPGQEAKAQIWLTKTMEVITSEPEATDTDP